MPSVQVADPAWLLVANAWHRLTKR